MVCDGNLTIDTIGVLKSLDKKISKAVIWTAGGAGSLIVFLKCIGMNYDQIKTKILELECLPILVYGGNLEPTNTTKEQISEWIDIILGQSKIFSKDVTLKEIYKMMRLFPSFITSEGILDPTKDVSLKDAVLCSMCNIGVFPKHIVDDTVYTGISKYNPFPFNIDSDNNNISTKTLFLTNFSKLSNMETISIFDGIENTFIQEYFDRIKNECLKFDRIDDDFLLINGIFTKSNLDQYDVKSRLKNGVIHADMFLEGTTTMNYMDDILLSIKNQS